MVSMRNIAGLLLALAAAPAVMGSPVIARADKDLSDLLGGGSGGDSTTADSDSVSTSVAKVSTTSVQQVTTTPTSTPQPITTSSPGVTSTPVTTTPTSVNNNSPTQITSSPNLQHTTTAPKIATVTDSHGSVQVVVITISSAADGGIVTQEIPTTAPTAAAGNGQDQPKEQPTNPAPIIGGVVGGVGGLLLIAGIGAVIYRVWGKNRHRGEEDDVLMGDGVYGTSELKGASGSNGPSPFTNNLEQYHAGKANPSANF